MATATGTARERAARLVDNVRRVIVGKDEAVRVTVAALLARGHVLVEDVPGVGKTTLAKALARSVDCAFSRVQATSDLLPSDIVGITLFNQRTHEFEFQQGPIFTNVLLLDEINRATPRTQSSLLQGMSEFEVTVDRVTYPLDRPFFVIATQNPIEQVGTYLLPESQLDRFAARVSMGYPDPAQEEEVLVRQKRRHPLDDLAPVLNKTEVCTLQDEVKEVRVDDALARYALALVRATRGRDEVACGASPRASLVLYRMAQAWALMDGRDYVLPDDLKALAVPVLAHRLLLPASLRASAADQAAVVRHVLQETKVP